jgi:hypothetical protein
MEYLNPTKIFQDGIYFGIGKSFDLVEDLIFVC